MMRAAVKVRDRQRRPRFSRQGPVCKIRRRDVIAGIAATAASRKADAFMMKGGTSNPTGGGIPTTGRALAVTIGGTTTVFAENSATNMGTFTDPFGYGISVACKRVINAAMQFVVDFRPDTNGGREEVVVRYGMLPEPAFKNGTAGVGPSVFDIVTPYTVNFYKNGVSLSGNLTVPMHWYGARWRWSITVPGGAINQPRPVMTNLAAMIAAGYVQKYETSKIYNAPTPTAYSWVWPIGSMDSSLVLNTGLQTAMSGEGGRPDIGPITEWQADYLMNGTSGSLQTLFAQGEVVATMPINWIDDQTGTFIDLTVWTPIAQFRATGSSQQVIPVGLTVIGGVTLDSAQTEALGRFTYDSAHAPGASWIPYVLTGDPYYLESLQAQATYPIAETQEFTVGSFNIKGAVNADEHRGWAWSMRSVWQARFGSPPAASCPSWLQPQEYWHSISNQNMIFANLYVNSPAKVHQYFHAFCRASQSIPWQMCMIATMLAWSQRMGFTEWLPFYKWFIAGWINYSSGLSPWPQNWSPPYYVAPIQGPNAPDFAQDIGLVTNTSLDSDTYASWAALAGDYFQAINGDAPTSTITGVTTGSTTTLHFSSVPAAFVSISGGGAQMGLLVTSAPTGTGGFSLATGYYLATFGGIVNGAGGTVKIEDPFGNPVVTSGAWTSGGAVSFITAYEAGGPSGTFGGPIPGPFLNADIDPYSTWSTTHSTKIERFVDNLGPDHVFMLHGALAAITPDGPFADTLGNTNASGPAYTFYDNGMTAFVAAYGGVGNSMRWAIGT